MNLTARQIFEAQEDGRIAAIMYGATCETAAPYIDAELAECWKSGVVEGRKQLAEQAALDKLARRVRRERR